jgi:DUF4097 and DUF4098 domain-containing protein YvlB
MVTSRWRRVRGPMFRSFLGVSLGAVLASGCGLERHFPQAEARDEWKRTYKIARGGTFELRNTNGRVRIRPGDADVIDIVATRVVKAGTEDEARKILSEFKIEETISGDGVLVDSTARDLGRVSRLVDYEVRLPAWVNVTLRSTNGDLGVDGLSGFLRAATTNGEVTASALEQGADVQTTNGDVRLEFAKLGDAGVECATTNGQISLTLPRDAKARVSASVSNGDISTSGLDVATSEKSRRKLEGTVGGGGPMVRLKTTNGVIDMRGR